MLVLQLKAILVMAFSFGKVMKSTTKLEDRDVIVFRGMGTNDLSDVDQSLMLARFAAMIERVKDMGYTVVIDPDISRILGAQANQVIIDESHLIKSELGTVDTVKIIGGGPGYHFSMQRDETGTVTYTMGGTNDLRRAKKNSIPYYHGKRRF
jgi:hypothetical protein